MIVHLATIQAIIGVPAIKVAQPFFLLGVQAQNRPITGGKRLAEPGDVLKLGVPQGTLAQAARFPIAAPAEAAEREQGRHEIPADGIPGVRHFSTDLPWMQTDPTHGLVLWCPGDIGVHGLAKRRNEAVVLVAFFFRPPPAFRTRPPDN